MFDKLPRRTKKKRGNREWRAKIIRKPALNETSKNQTGVKKKKNVRKLINTVGKVKGKKKKPKWKKERMEKEPTLRVRNGKKKKAHKYILSVSLVTDTSIYIYVV